MLTADQIFEYQRDGAIVVEGVVPDAMLARIRADIAAFEDEARGLSASNDRLDLEDSHTPERPRVRRIKRPDLISNAVRELLRSDEILALVRNLLGPDVRLHTTKLNMKSAGHGAAVEWHQDFAFYPHTNDDLLAVGVMIDDTALENGPLMVFPGSHTGPIHDHHQNGVFVGAMDLAACGLSLDQAVPLTGPAGSISIHHARAIHGSSLNTSDRDRRLLLFEMAAADAFPLMGSMTPFDSLAAFDARMLCGAPTVKPRLADIPVRIPQPQPDKAGSIYDIQSGLQNRAFEQA